LWELDCDLSPAFVDDGRLKALGLGLAGVLTGAPSLRSLRLSGRLPLDAVFLHLEPALPFFQGLTALYLANGTEAWGIHAVAAALKALPALQQLEIRFARWVQGLRATFFWSAAALCSKPIHGVLGLSVHPHLLARPLCPL
jgi:hypothetical protein